MEHILIIEDEKDVNQLLAKTLQDNGYQTASAFNGLEGLGMLKKEHFDMVLLDLMLPYKSGDEVLREIREHSDIPVIVISAKDMVGTKIDLLMIGADDNVIKTHISNLRNKMKKVNSETEYIETVWGLGYRLAR